MDSAVAAAEAVIGSALLDGGPLHLDALRIAPEWMPGVYAPVWRSMLAVSAADGCCDPVLVTAWADGEGLIVTGSWLADVMDSAPPVPRYAQWAHLLEDAYRLNAMRHAAEGVGKAGTVGDAFAGLQAAVADAARSVSSPVITAREQAAAVFKDVEERYKRRGEPVGVTTGLAEVDGYLQGLEAGNLAVLAGRPGMGKTAFAMGVARHVADTVAGAVLVFTLEMSVMDLMRRMLSADSGIYLSKFRSGEFRSADWPKLAPAIERLPANLVISDASNRLNDIIATCHQIAATQGVSMVVIDYLQLVTVSGGRSRQEEVAGISSALKQLSKDVGAPVLALSQLNRQLEARTDKRPIPADLRESGALEQDADQIMFVYRGKVYDESVDATEAEIIVAKNRHGATGVAKARWDANRTRFTDCG